MSIDDIRINSTVIIINFSGKPALIAVAVTINATSPRAIIPTPAIALSRMSYLKHLATAPQPTTLPISPINTARNANRNSIPLSPKKVILLIPIFAKNTGANIV